MNMAANACRALCLLLAVALFAPSFPFTLRAQEAGTSTSPSDLASTTPPSDTGSTTEPGTPVPATDAAASPIPDVTSMSDSAPPPSFGRFFAESASVPENVIFSNTSTAVPLPFLDSGGYVAIDQKMIALHSGAIQTVQVFLSQYSGGVGKGLRIAVYDESGTAFLCQLIDSGEDFRAPEDAEWRSIPIAEVPTLLEWQARRFGDHCTFEQGVTYTIRLSSTAGGIYGFARLYSAGDAPNDFYFVGADATPVPPPEPTLPPSVPGTVLARSSDASWNEHAWSDLTSYGYNVDFSGVVTYDGVVTDIIMPLGYYYDASGYSTYFVLEDAFGNAYDCRTPEKTFQEWGVYNNSQGHHWNTVTIGPFSGSECDTSLRLFLVHGGVMRPRAYSSSGDNLSPYLGAPGYVNFTSGLAETPFIVYSATSTARACTENCNSSVLFLPGMEGSRLYDASGKRWEPTYPHGNEDELALFLDAGGHSIDPNIHTEERDIIRSTPTGDVYGPLMDSMDALKASGAIADWEPIAYDWRLSIDDILSGGRDFNGSIYYSGASAATSTPYIIQELRRLAATSKTGKVSILAHSNGGLVAKRLTELLGADAPKLIDKILFVAVPQAGTPQAVATGMHGYDQDLVFGQLVTKATARSFASTSPVLFNLLPSSEYFSYVDDPVVSFDSSLPDWISRYGSPVIHSRELLARFLSDSYGKVASADNSAAGVNQPIQVPSATLMESANALHNSLDAWTPPQGIKLIQIAGWGVAKTPTGITYKKKGTGVEPDWNTTVDGDGTVVVPSALWTSKNNIDVENFYINLHDYNSPIRYIQNPHSFQIEHGTIFSVPTLDEFISDLVRDSKKPIQNYSYISNVIPQGNGTRLRYSLHSPLSLDLYDDQGRHTGISTTTGQIEEEIPGTYYSELGDVKYIFVDSDVSAHIVMKGYASGTFTYKVDEYEGDTHTGSTAYTDVPTTPNTVVTTETVVDASSTAPLLIDQNGDGQTDIYASQDDGTLSLDELIVNLKTAVNALTTPKSQQKTQLLNKIANIEAKIAKQKQKQSSVLAKLQSQIQKKAGKGKIDAATANALSSTLDDLIAADTTVPLDPTLLQQLTSVIYAANITAQVKTSLLNKVTRVAALAGVNRSLDTMTKAVTKKGAKGILTDAETQNLLNLLEQIQGAI